MKCIGCGCELTTGDIDGVCVSCRNAGFSQLFKPPCILGPAPGPFDTPPEFPTSNYGQQGWVCPRCGQVNAPWKSKCDCPPPSITTSDTQTKIDFP